MSLSEAYPTQYCCNLRAGGPQVRVKIPGKLRHDSLLEMESPGMSRRDGLQRIGSLGRSRRDGLPRIGSLGRSMRDNLLGPLGLEDPQTG